MKDYKKLKVAMNLGNILVFIDNIMDIKFNIGDEVETILGDIGYITAITIYQTHIKYCVRMTEDKDQWLYDWQIKNKRSNVIK